VEMTGDSGSIEPSPLVTEPWKLGRPLPTETLRRSEDVVWSTVKRWISRRKRRRQDQCDTDESMKKAADEKLHDQAHRLHVLEWEAYGHPKPRKKG